MEAWRGRDAGVEKRAAKGAMGSPLESACEQGADRVCGPLCGTSARARVTSLPIPRPFPDVAMISFEAGDRSVRFSRYWP